MRQSSARPFLDRPIARVLALSCFALCVAALAYIHRDDLYATSAATPAPSNDPVARCLAERAGDIDEMVREGGISEAQAESLKERVEALCRDDAGAP